MRNDQIFVLILVILLPMSGCFDGAVGDAEADDTEETTVINNYYNNTTIVESESNEPEYFVVGGMVDNNTTINDYPYYYPYNFSTTSGQTLYIHQLSVTDGLILLISDCGEGGVWTTPHTQTDYSQHHNGYWVAGSSFDCEHTVRLAGQSSGFLGTTFGGSPPYYFSMIYSIENMSVIAL